jgi:hypothetical protein
VDGLRLTDPELVYLALAVDFAQAEAEVFAGERETAYPELECWAFQCERMSPVQMARAQKRLFRQARKAIDRMTQTDVFTTCSRHEVENDG